jgi:hypothetical protein
MVWRSTNVSSVEHPHEPWPDSPFAAARTRKERLRRLRGRELLRGVQALAYLPLAAIVLDRWGLQRAQQRLARQAPTRRSHHVRADTRILDEARRLAWVVDGTARRGPWKANCLQRSLVLWWFLLRRGIASEIRIGVRRRPGAPSGARELDFHAWVECQGLVLNDRSDVREVFATFDRAIAPPDAHWR